MTKVLFVDDDVNLLQATQRRLRKTFQVDIAAGGGEGLSAITEKGPYAVIIADLVMPGMDGFMFIERARGMAQQSIFIMLTGNADLEASINALNKGYIFRFLTKPCKLHILEKAILEGAEQFQKNLEAHKTNQTGVERRSRKKILIVDDDPEVLSVLSSTLTATDRFDILTAENGRVALSLLSIFRIDIIIADREMPEVDGITLLSTVREKYPWVDRFFLTWLPEISQDKGIKDLELSGCFEKPIDTEKIITALVATLRSGLRGQIGGIGTASFLQMIEMEEKTCSIVVRSMQRSGVLYFRKGRLIGAETMDLKNEAAACEIINWKEAVIEIENVSVDREIGIHRPLMHVLMEAARIKDEAGFNE
jgi:DNA-binding NtrC family response regulator